MNGWREVTLAEVASEVTVGHVGSMAKHYVEDGIPFLRSLNVNPHCINLKDVKYISSEFHTKLSKSALLPGDVVTVRTGKPGTTSVIPVELPVANCSDLVITRPGPELNARWLSYYMNSIASDFIDSQLVGAVQQHFNVGSAKSMKINLPPLPYQEAIVGVLGALDDKIAANTKLAQTSRELAGAEFTRLVKTPGTSATLRDVLRLEYGKSLAAKKRVEGDVDVFGSGGIVGKHNEPLLTGPGVIVGRKGTAGSVHWAPRAYFPIDTTFYVVPTDSDISLIFCFHLLKSLPLSEMNSDSAVPGLNREEALSTPIRVPEKSEIQRFSALADHLFSVAQQSEQESKTLASMRDALLPQLMSGKLRVKDAEKTVEETL